MSELTAHHGPWAILPDFAREALHHIDSIDLADALRMASDAMAARGESAKEAKPYEVNDGVAVVPIVGMLTKEYTCATWLFGGTSTVETRRVLRAAAADESVKRILLLVDSPGGQVSGTADLAADIERINREKPITAYIEDMGCSAALWLASQAGEVYANQTATVGSIGTVMSVRDTSRMMGNAGVNVHVISSGQLKGAGTPGAPVTTAHLAAWQESVDEITSVFVSAIASGRGMSEESVRELATGGVWIGQKAVDAGLVDRVCGLDEVMTSLRSAAKARPRATSRPKASGETTPATQVAQENPMTLKQLLAKLKGQPDAAEAAGITQNDVDAMLASIETIEASAAPLNAIEASVTTLRPIEASVPAEVTEEIKRLQAQAAQFGETIARNEAATFVDAMVRAGKADPVEREKLAGLYLAAAKADGGGVAAIEAGAVKAGPVLSSLKETLEARPAHARFQEQISADNPGQAAERRQRYLSATAEGRKLLEANR